jgi:1-acyl-sn-glycerol-3-phosphate acyltransferase
VLWLPVKALTRVEYLAVPQIEKVRGGLLIAANHQSYLDPVLIGLAWPQPICYLARRSLFRIPGLNVLMRSLNAHPIARGRVDSRGVRTVLGLLRRGEAVLVFPEGTRTRDGSLGRFRPGIASLAIRCHVPVLPACIEGAYRCWPRTRPLPRAARVAVAFGGPLRPEGEDAGQLTRRVREEIKKLQALLRERPGMQANRV